MIGKTSSNSTAVPVPASGIHDITIQLLTQLRQTVTTLALTFKPPLTAEAIRPYLDKLTDQVGRLVSCVLAAAGGGGEATSSLVESWNDAVVRVGDEIQRLLTILEKGVREPQASSSKGESPYLAHTGMVWEAIDKVSGTLPTDERSAVQQCWEGQKDTVRDAWTEFKEMLEDADEDDDEDDIFGAGDEDDDEWAELEKAMGGKMTADEKKRAETVSFKNRLTLANVQAKSVFGLHQILHATVPRYLHLLELQPEMTYGPLLAAGAEVVAALDTAISGMYPKQDVAEIIGSVDALNAKGRALATAFRARLAQSAAPEDQGAVAKSFVDRWETRLDLEVKAWDEAKLSMSALADALE